MRYIADNNNRKDIESFDDFNELLQYFSDTGGIIYIYDFLTFQKKVIIINTITSQYYTTEKIDQIFWL